MPDSSIDSVLARVGMTISRLDALTALRRARELETLVRRLPPHVLPPVRDRLAVVTSNAEQLRHNCALAAKTRAGCARMLSLTGPLPSLSDAGTG